MPAGCPPAERGARAAETGDRDPTDTCDDGEHVGGDGVSVEIANESGAAVDEPALAGLARHVLDEMRVHPLAELSVLLVDEAAMTELHVRWMGEDGPTDVLAFPMDELRPPQPGGMHADYDPSDPSGIPGLLGDVVICPQVAAVQARRARHAVHEEIDLLCTHGILHLLGYDHADPAEHATMFGLQDRLLASWRAESAGAESAGVGPAVAAPAGAGPAGAGPAGAGPAGGDRAGGDAAGGDAAGGASGGADGDSADGRKASG
jgi:probable rRNA maturation factor